MCVVDERPNYIKKEKTQLTKNSQTKQKQKTCDSMDKKSYNKKKIIYEKKKKPTINWKKKKHPVQSQANWLVYIE